MVKQERGYLIPAVNDGKTDYIKCAIELAKSIKHWHPSASVCLLTDAEFENDIFDYVKILPHGCATNKQSNDWQVFYSSPYRETIKLEADMIATSPIDHYWTLFEKRDIVISLGARDFYGNPTNCRFYRKIFDNNQLPDVYNAITYWRLSRTAKEFFDTVRVVFDQWEEVKKCLKFPDEQPTTDVVYGVAAVIMGVENVTLPQGIGPTIVHMKKGINPIASEDWTKELLWEWYDNELRVGTIAQTGFFHYNVKEWLHG